MFEKIKEIEDRFKQLESELSRPDIFKDQKRYQKYTKEHSQLSPIINFYRKYNSIREEIENNTPLLEDSDPEIKGRAREEIDSILKDERKREIIEKAFASAADRDLNTAKRFMKARNYKAARTKLERLVQNYGETKAATAAQSLLEKMDELKK